MARMRTVKPALRTSRVVGSWPIEVRYFWVLLWGWLDDEGRGLDMPKAISGDCFPLDDKYTPAVIDKWLTLMAKTHIDPNRHPPLCRYEVAGIRYIHSVYWREHERPNRPTPSVHPSCPVHEPRTESLSEPPLSPQMLVLEGLSIRELEGMRAEPRTEQAAPPPEQQPPSKCPKHENTPATGPCGACADARQAAEAWKAAKRARLAAAPQCDRHRGQPAHNCALCRAETIEVSA